MIQGIYQSAVAADGLETWNNVLARNLSAAASPGFKREVMLFDGVLSGVMAHGTNPSRPVEQAIMSPVAHTGVNFTPGDLHRTGDPMEFAIEGRGFFRLQRPDGEFVYTRDGQFRVSADGRLQSKQGYDVVGDAGPIQLLIDGGPLSIDAENRVRQGDQEVGILTVFDFQNLAGLRRANGGYVVESTNPQFAQPLEDVRVRQGFVELSNVSPMHEMADLITINHALQANHRMIQTFDGLTERAVQVLGNTQG
jgi:flagellar basal body rod protein FlgG